MRGNDRPETMRVKTAEVIAMRVCAVLAAVGLVGAVALASALPPNEPLGQAIAEWDDAAMPALQRFELHHLGGWAWDSVTQPVLARPSWMLPFVLGVVCLGFVMSLSWRAPRRK